LFSESNTRFLLEVRPEHADALEAALAGVPHAMIGQVTEAEKLVILDGKSLVLEGSLAVLKEAWQKPLRW
jgi:phosphoribosylformylglycinamidine synthase